MGKGREYDTAGVNLSSHGIGQVNLSFARGLTARVRHTPFVSDHKPRTYRVRTSDQREPIIVTGVVGEPRDFFGDVSFPHADGTNTQLLKRRVLRRGAGLELRDASSPRPNPQPLGVGSLVVVESWTSGLCWGPPSYRGK